MKASSQLATPPGAVSGQASTKAPPAKADSEPLLSIGSAVFKDVNVALQAGLGQTTLTIEELLALKAGSVLKLDLKMNGLIELRLNQTLVARGEIVAVDDNFGVRIVEIATAS